MTAKQANDQKTVNGSGMFSPQEAVALLARIDASLDELYALREYVRDRVGFQPNTPQAELLRETVAEEAAISVPISQAVSRKVASDERYEATRLAAAALPADSFVRQLSGSLGSGLPDVLYTNAEIDEMRFGDEWL